MWSVDDCFMLVLFLVESSGFLVVNRSSNNEIKRILVCYWINLPLASRISSKLVINSTVLFGWPCNQLHPLTLILLQALSIARFNLRNLF